MSNPESARQDGTFIAISVSPDFCRTPPTNAPIPYQISASLDQSLSVSPDVRYQGFPVVLAEESSIGQVTGDEGGSGGGVKSGCNLGTVEFVAGAATVKANGRRIVRDQDPVRMNGGNVEGAVISMAGTEPA